MDPQRWRRLSELFDAALGQPDLYLAEGLR
jgi:hypothetical protein